MRAGQLRHRVTIQRATESQSTSGAVRQTWARFADRYAEVMPQEGREALAAKQTYAELTHLVRLRYVAGVTPKMRIQFGARIFDILGVIRVDERAHEMQLACVERGV